MSIHADVPANSANGRTVIRAKCCGSRISPQAITSRRLFAIGRPELFYDPNTNTIIGHDTQVWQYNFAIPAATAFVQQGTAANPMVYWLDVQAVVPGTRSVRLEDV